MCLSQESSCLMSIVAEAMPTYLLEPQSALAVLATGGQCLKLQGKKLNEEVLSTCSRSGLTCLTSASSQRLLLAR